MKIINFSYVTGEGVDTFKVSEDKLNSLLFKLSSNNLAKFVEVADGVYINPSNVVGFTIEDAE